MNKRNFGICIALICQWSFGCEAVYQPSGQSYHHIDTTQIHNPVLEIGGPADTGDTLGLWGTSSITLSTDREVRSIEIYVNDKWFCFGPSINTNNLTDGYYDFRFVFHLSSGTGSLADQLDQDEITVEKTKTVHIDNAPPDNITIDSLVWRDNKIKIQWNANPDKNFSYYSLVRESDYWGEKYIQITDSTTHVFVDSATSTIFGKYLGYYSISIYKKNGLKKTITTNIYYGDRIPLQYETYHPDAYISVRPIPSPVSDEIYMYEEYHSRIIAVSDITHTIVKTYSTNVGSYYPAFALSNDGHTIIGSTGTYRQIYFINADDFTTRKAAIPSPYAGDSPSAPLCITAYGQLLYHYSIASGVYMLDSSHTKEKYIPGSTFYKSDISDDGLSFYTIGFWSNQLHINKFNVHPDTLIHQATASIPQLIGSMFDNIQVGDDQSRIFVLSGDNTIHILDALTLASVATITISGLTGTDRIQDFFTKGNFLYISYSQKRPTDYHSVFGKIDCYDLTTLTKTRQWLFQDFARKISISRQGHHLYAFSFRFSGGSSYEFSPWIVPLN